MESDLPSGYRWATADETENWENIPGIIIAPRTSDSNGTLYIHDEADMAVPVTLPVNVAFVAAGRGWNGDS